jgi:hypothetical protein
MYVLVFSGSIIAAAWVERAVMKVELELMV